MKKSIQTVVAVVVIASMTGCASPYMVDRKRDAADIFTATLGKGGGVRLKASFLQPAMMFNKEIAGCRGGSVFTNVSEGQYDFYSPIPPGLLWDRMFFGRSEFTGADVVSQRGKDIDAVSYVPFIVQLDDHSRPCMQFYTQIEASFGLVRTITLGFNPGELLDFTLGWTTIDIFSDDLEARKRKEKIEPKPDGDGLKPAP